MSNHTPGPWKASLLYGAVRVQGAENQTIVHVAKISPRDPVALADAHLIAAAPELLDACEAQDEYEAHVKHCRGCDWSDRVCETGWHLWNTAQNLRAAAIAKAKGERE